MQNKLLRTFITLVPKFKLPQRFTPFFMLRDYELITVGKPSESDALDKNETEKNCKLIFPFEEQNKFSHELDNRPRVSRVHFIDLSSRKSIFSLLVALFVRRRMSGKLGCVSH
jgi:hypothetical protein